MVNNKSNTYVSKLKRGLASAALLATIGVNMAPVIMVSAEVIDYTHTGVTDRYKTEGTGQYFVDINPMMGHNTSEDITPKGGSYTVKQIAQYTRTGERIVVEGNVQTVNIFGDSNNGIRLDWDGEYEITPKDRVPGFLKDIGATHKVDASGTEEEVKDGAGKYVYAYPLITDGVPSGSQTINFQPKLTEARQDLEVTKIGDDQKTPLAGVSFTVYKKFDAQLDKEYGEVGVKVGETLTTNEQGKVVFKDLIEGEYYFVEEGNVPNLYLPDQRKVEFNVVVEDNEKDVSIVAVEDGDVNTEGKNKRGNHEGNTITRFNYKDTVQLKNRTYQELYSNYVGKGEVNTTKGQATGQNEGVVYVNTNGVVEYTSSVDIPKNINDMENFTVVDTVDNKVTIDPTSIELRTMSKEGLTNTYKLNDLTDLVHNGQTITLNAKGSQQIRTILEAGNVDQYILTYKATVDTDKINKNVAHEELTFTQGFTTDETLLDVANPTKETVHITNVRVREGQIVIDKEGNDGTNKKLAGAEFQLYVEDSKGDLEYGGTKWSKASSPREGNANYFGATDSEGKLTFDYLPYDKYLIVETKAPEGYRLNRNHKVVDVVADQMTYVDGVGNTQTAQIKNMRQNQIFPGTGTGGNIATIVMLVTAGGTFTYVTVRKRDEEELQL